MMKAWIARIRHSLAARLLLISIGSMLSIFLVLIVFFGAGWGHKFERVISPHLEQYRQYLLTEIGSPPNRQKAAALAARLPLGIYIFDRQGNWSSSGERLDREALTAIPRHQNTFRLNGERGPFYVRNTLDNAEVYFAFNDPPPDMIKLILLLVVGSILLLTYYLIRKLFRPLHSIRDGVEVFSRGDFKHRIETSRCDELGELVGRVNHMAEEIDAMLQAKRDLLLAISHELRSPLTRSKVALELLEPNAITDGIRRDLNEMQQLLSEILESERLKSSNSHRVLERALYNVPELVNDVLDKLDPEEQRIVCHCELNPAEWSLDKARFKLLLHNLLSNALRYNRDGIGPVTVELDYLDGCLQVRICDHGDGIAAEHLAHLTEPFYRVDPSRQRKTGGYGLGLHLCQAIAESHGGTLQITSQSGKGTQVTVTLAPPTPDEHNLDKPQEPPDPAT